MPDLKIKPPRPTPKTGAAPARPAAETRFVDRVSAGAAEGRAAAAAATPVPTGLRLVTLEPNGDGFSQAEEETGRRQSSTDAYLGATIDNRYRVEALLGKGGMGVVYRCTHVIIGKKVAMKVLRADLARDSDLTERFLNEAKAAGAIGNPHIIDISDFGRFPDGATYFVMEYLVGATLSQAIESGGRLPLDRILSIASQLAEGLAAAHAAGIVHRDLKPDNIYLVEHAGQPDFVKILDFGIAKVSTAGRDRLTRAGAVFGTPHYMSPEQAAGSPVDARGDIYSLGVILYEMINGQPPFDADNFMSVLSQHMYKAPPPIRWLNSEPSRVSTELEGLVLRCLAKRPEERYPSMQVLREELDRLRRGGPRGAGASVAVRPALPQDPIEAIRAAVSTPELSESLFRPTWQRRWRSIAGFAVGLALLAVVLVNAGGQDDPASVDSVTAAPAAPIHAPKSAPRQLIVAVEPLDAHVFRGPTDLGASPVMLRLPEGEKAVLVARRRGYRDATITLDGTAPRTAIKLELLEPSSPTPKRKGSGTKKPEKEKSKRRASATTEIIDPWK